MPRFYQGAVLTLASLTLTLRSSGEEFRAIASVRLDELVAGSDYTASPVFLSEESVALLVRTHNRANPPISKALILQLTNRQLQTKAKSGDLDGLELFSASNNRLVIAGPRKRELFSSDLKQSWPVPGRVTPAQFPRANFSGEFDQHAGRVFRLTTPPMAVRSDIPVLLAISDEALAYRTEGAIRIESIDGRQLGSLAERPGTHDFRSAQFAGPGRLYLSYYNNERIVDFNGKEIVRIQHQDGWGFRNGWSADGERILFDRYTRSVPLSERFIEWLFDAFGTVISEEANGETVRVMETMTGRVCFNLENRGKLLGKAGQYHADLSPSGRLVAVATQVELNIYELPERCEAK
jgi:hypothetical protein